MYEIKISNPFWNENNEKVWEIWTEYWPTKKSIKERIARINQDRKDLTELYNRMYSKSVVYPGDAKVEIIG